MRMWRALCLSALSCAVADALAGVFPKDFAWGAATAAYQIEGAYRDDGRGMTIWDTFSHTPGKVAGDENGDVADDSYHKYKEDIQLAADMGISHYRFSLAWSRILPTGDFPVNPSGIKFYDRVINLCLDKGIEPFVTLYHWDIPQALEDQYQGWLSEKSIASFARYAEVAFLNFGDRVKYWLTFNEPLTFIDAGYSQGVHAPGRCSDRGRCEQGDSAREPYIVAHNVLRAHARAVAIFRELKLATNRIAHDGEIGITLNIDWAEPRSSSPEDKQAAQRLMEFNLAWFADPVFFGHYPDVMVKNVGDRLPKFTEDEVSLLKGSYDFFGLNHYTSKYVFAPRSPIQHGSYEEDAYIESSYYDQDGNLIGAQGESSWLHVVPWGFRNILNWVADRYDNPGIFVTENGCSVPKENELPVKEALNDDFRVNFYRDYIGNMSLAIDDGVYMRGYFAWSLLDNFEWADGYSVRFGLHYVDYKNGRKRYPKKSAKWYKKHIASVRRKSGDNDDNREKDEEVSNADDNKVLPHDIDIDEDEPTTAASGRLSTTRGALLSATGIAGAFALVTIASIFGRRWYRRRQHDRIPSRTSAPPRYTPVGSSNGNSTSDREAHEL